MPDGVSAETVSAQLQLRTPNELGSAAAGAATPTAATRVAAPTRILVSKYNSPASVQLTVTSGYLGCVPDLCLRRYVYHAKFGQYALMLAPTKYPA